MAVITLTKLIVEADRADNLSASGVPKAKITKGIPKKARLPNTVVTIKRYRVFLSLIIFRRYVIMKNPRTMKVGANP